MVGSLGHIFSFSITLIASIVFNFLCPSESNDLFDIGMDWKIRPFIYLIHHQSISLALLAFAYKSQDQDGTNKIWSRSRKTDMSNHS